MPFTACALRRGGPDPQEARMKQNKDLLSVNKSKEQKKSLKDNPRQPWERPHIRQLRVSLDTAFTIGSIGDGFTGSI